MLSRRRFLRTGSLSALALGPLSHALGAETRASGSLKIGTGQEGAVVPADFMGLSYENMQLEDASFFSPANKGLIEQFRAIAPRGVLRLGGNTSEFGWWQATAGQAAPKRVDSPWKATGEPTAATLFAITPEAIDNLNGFLLATGWSCIYGLNLGYGTVETDLPEAEYVSKRLGSRLEYFQIGNEVDLFKGHLRDPQTWDVRHYLEQWLVIANAVGKALPGVRFGMPDVAADVTWLAQIAALWPGVAQKPNVVTMSHHYYWKGPPSNPEATIANLMRTDAKVAELGAMSREASQQMGPKVTWRMTEGNTVYRGGKPELSDVFAAALWAADYLLQLMTMGYCGVNLHGGSGHAQAVSVGGTFVGERLMKDATVPHPKPFYTPIANEGTLAGAGVDGKLNGKYVLEPVGYGMKFVAPFMGGTMLPLEFDAGGLNATAYAARVAGRTLIAVLNKDAGRALTLDVPAHRVVSTLEAAGLESHEARLTAGEAGAGGRQLTVPAHTAMLVELAG